MKAGWLAAALLFSAPSSAEERPAPGVRVIVTLPHAPTLKARELLDRTDAELARLLGKAVRRGADEPSPESPVRRVWSSAAWAAEVPGEERARVLAELRRDWGDALRVEPDDLRPAALAARDRRAEHFARTARAETALASRIASMPDHAPLFDGGRERVTDAVAAAPALPPSAPSAPPPAGPTATLPDSPKPAAPPAPPQAARPAVGEPSPEDCSPLRGKGSRPTRDLSATIEEESRCTGVEASVIKALIAAKGGSRRNPLQVTPSAADWIGVRGNLNDPRTSIRAGALLLAKLVRFFHGDLHRALAAYEAGTTQVVRSGGIPNTRAVKELLAGFEKAYRADGAHPVETVLPPERPNARQLEESAKAVLTGDPQAPRVSFSATAPFRKMIEESARMYGVDPALIEAVILSESEGNPRNRSPAGAKGLMQLMPETARAFGVKNPYDPAQNIRGGTRYLKELIDRYDGNVVLAVAAYNAGPNRSSLSHGRVPTIFETVSYVTRVFSRYSQLTGTRMKDVSSYMTATGKRWCRHELKRLQRLWGPDPSTTEQ